MMLFKRKRSERGVTAIVTAGAALALFALSALSIDVGNVWSHRRQLQSQADMAALAGAPLLPRTQDTQTDIVDEVVDYLGKNPVEGQLATTTRQMLDLDVSNGEVTFPTANEVKVVTPQATVSITVGKVTGVDDQQVAASATAGIYSPQMGGLPLFLPAGCSYGLQIIKDSNQDPEPSPIYDPAGSSTWQVDTISPTEITTGMPPASPLKITGSRWGSPTEETLTVQFTRDDQRPTVQPLPGSLVTDPRDRNNTFMVEIPPAVYQTAGIWHVRIAVGDAYSATERGLVVTSTPEPGCGGRAEGDFGLLDIPRATSATLSDRLALNIILGMDHDPVVFPAPRPPRVPDSCRPRGNTLWPGAVLDDVSIDGVNCLNILNGNRVSHVTEGFITGLSPYKGLLDKPTTEGCDRNGASSPLLRIGKELNNDVLSCFLKPGVTVGNVSTPTAVEHGLTSDIFSSPRFAYVPIIDYAQNPPNGYYAISDFRPVFITDETSLATKGASTATTNNGVLLNGGNTKLGVLQVVAINPRSLPPIGDSSGPIVEYVGEGIKVVHLND